MRPNNWLKSREGQLTVASFAFLVAALAVLSLLGLDSAVEFLAMLTGSLLGVALAYLLTLLLYRWGRLAAFVLVLLYFLLPFFDLLVLSPRGYNLLSGMDTTSDFLVRGFMIGFFVVAVLGLLSPASIKLRGRTRS